MGLGQAVSPRKNWGPWVKVRDRVGQGSLKSRLCLGIVALVCLGM